MFLLLRNLLHTRTHCGARINLNWWSGSWVLGPQSCRATSSLCGAEARTQDLVHSTQKINLSTGLRPQPQKSQGERSTHSWGKWGVMCNISRNINSLKEVGSSVQVFCILTEFVSNYTINYHEKNKICSCNCEFLYFSLCQFLLHVFWSSAIRFGTDYNYYYYY